MSNWASAQQPKPEQKEPKTKLEAFDQQVGIVIIKGYQDIGKVSELGAVSVDCAELINASTGNRQLGIRIEVKESGRLERENISFIDYDEIEPLLKGIDYISKVTSSATKLQNFEATYKTKGDLSIVTFSSGREAGKISAGVKSGHIGSASAYISLEKLATLRNLISQAKQKLDSIK
jgi:hypothetical protein